MKQEQIKKLEKLSDIVKEYNDKKELLDNGKILSNGYYRDYFIANNTTKNKPVFNFAVLIILICVFLIPAICTLNEINFATIIFLIAFLIGVVVLIVFYKKNISHWVLVKSKFNNDLQQYEKIVKDLLNQMQKYKNFMMGVDLLEVDNLLLILKLDGVKSLSEAVQTYNNQKKQNQLSIIKDKINISQNT